MSATKGVASSLATALIALLAAGCGGSDSDAAAPGAGVGPPEGASGPLDVELRAALADAGIEPVVVRRAESPAMIALGQALFFDPILSGNRDMACATCHHPTAATGDALPLSLGTGAVGLGAARTATAADQVIARNAPPLYSLAARDVDALFWDGRVGRDPATGELEAPSDALDGPNPTRPDLVAQLTTALAAQAMFPVTSPEEMRGDPGENELADAPDEVAVWAGLMARLVGTAEGTVGGIEAYRDLFRAAFPEVASLDALTFAHAARAIAAFEVAAFARLDTPLDAYLAGDDGALSTTAKRGALLFTGQARCARCHGGPLLSDLRHHALATPQLGPGVGPDAPDDRGRALVSGDRRDDYRFRTPPLRNVARTGPWMHAGAFSTLEAVLRHYRNPARSLLEYDAAQLPPAFAGLVDRDPTRNQARLAAVDPIVGRGLRFDDDELADLVTFLEEALTSPTEDAGLVPAAVPSGLPVQ